MARPFEASVPIVPLNVSSFSGGINTSVPQTEIADNECRDILNMEFNEGDDLIVRAGIYGYSDTGSLWDVARWDVDYWGVNTYSSKITSIYNFKNNAGFVAVLYTTGNRLISSDLSGNITDITGSLNLPDDTLWQWTTLNGIAVGVNGTTVNDATIKVTGPSPGTAALLGGNPPKGKLITRWKNRLWMVRADQPNQVQCSDLGNPEGWNTDAGANPAHGAIFDIDKDDGDQIIALFATKTRLFAFKKESIHYAQFASDTTRLLTDLSWEIYATEIGCLATNSVRQAFDDVVFLSRGGLSSLAAAQVFADFESTLISTKVKDISRIAKNVVGNEINSFIIQDMSQYWLSVPANISPTGANAVYILDYKRAKEAQPLIRWTRFDGYAFGTAYEVVPQQNQQLTYWIGCHDTTLNRYFIGKYIPKDEPRRYRDGPNSYRKSIVTKSYNVRTPDKRKFWKEWLLRIILETDATVSINYFYDGGVDIDGSYQFAFTVPATGSLWDVMLWDVDSWDGATPTVKQNIRRAFKQNDSGRKAVEVAFEIFNNQIDEGYIVNSFGVKYGVLSEHKSSTV